MHLLSRGNSPEGKRSTLARGWMSLKQETWPSAVFRVVREEILGNQTALDSRKSDHIFIVQTGTFESKNKGQSSHWNICLNT